MPGSPDVERAGHPAHPFHPLDQVVDLPRVAGDGALGRRGVHRDGHVGVVLFEFSELSGGELDGRHPARAAGVDVAQQPGAEGHHPQAVGDRQRTGDHGRGDLAHRVTDDRSGLDPVRSPGLPQRHLHPEQDLLPRSQIRRRDLSPEHGAERELALRGEDRVQLVHRGAERGFGLQQSSPHPRPLRAVPGEHEHDARITGFTDEGPLVRARLGDLPQPPGQSLVVAGDHGGAMCEVVPPGGQRRGHIAEPGVVVDPVGEVGGTTAQRRRGARGEGEHVRDAARVRIGFGVRPLLQHDVGVRAAEAERRHARSGDPGVARPSRTGACHAQGLGVEVDVRAGFVEVQARRDPPVDHRQHHLDQPDEPGGALQVPEVALDRAEQQRPAGGARTTEHRTERFRLDRIAQGRSRPVRLHVVHCGRIEVGVVVRIAQQRPLRVGVRGDDPVGTAVGVGRSAAHEREHPVAVPAGVGEALDEHDTAPLPPHDAVGGGGEGLAAPVRGEHARAVEVRGDPG